MITESSISGLFLKTVYDNRKFKFRIVFRRPNIITESLGSGLFLGTVNDNRKFMFNNRKFVFRLDFEDRKGPRASPREFALPVQGLRKGK